MGIYKAELGRMTLLVVLLLFFLFPLIKQGIAGGAGQASEPKNCIDVTSVQLDTCLIAIIVELDLSIMTSVDKMAAQQVKKKSESIQAAQDTVLNSMEDQNTAYVRRYKLLPYIAISTDGNGIVKLLSIPQVKAIVPDLKLSAQGNVVKTQ